MGVKVQADIPFQFELSNRVLPPGSYELSFLGPTTAPVMQVREIGKGEGAAVLAQERWTSRNSTQDPVVVFNRYDDRQFLAGLAWPGRHFDVFKSKSEKALVTSRLVGAAKPDEVRVMARLR